MTSEIRIALTRGIRSWQWLVAILLIALLIGCRTSVPASGSPVLGGDGFRFANEERLREHWLKHGPEFGSGVTESQYLGKAQAFFQNRSTEKLYKHRPNGDELQYLPGTNEFGVLSEEQIIRTYFRPNTGRRYWERQ